MPPQEPTGQNVPDPKSFLLPKKDAGPSPDSAQRVNAAALLAQEEQAAKEGTKASADPTSQKSSDLPSSGAPGATPAGQTFAPQGQPASAQPGKIGDVSAPTAPPAPKKEESVVAALQTYSADITKVVQEGGVSAVTVAAAEAERRARATTGEPQAPGELNPQPKESSSHIVLIIAGSLLVLAGLGIVAMLVLLPPTNSPVHQSTGQIDAPLMTVDQAVPITIGAQTVREQLMTQLEAAREQLTLSLGLVGWLNVSQTSASGGTPQPVAMAQVLSILAPNIPPDLVRTIQPTGLIGVHSYDENQAFMVLRVDSYQQAYAGMLSWETTMEQELSPLFVRHPSPQLPPATQTTASSTATTTGAVATSTAATSSTQTQPQGQAIFLPTKFVDQVVENHDARVVLNSAGDILLLWTFVDRNTIVITTNEATLREVIRRLNTAAVVPQP